MRATEFTVDTDDEDLQADYTSDFYTMLFSHPEVVGEQFWAKTIDDNKGLYAYDWRESQAVNCAKTLERLKNAPAIIKHAIPQKKHPLGSSFRGASQAQSRV